MVLASGNRNKWLNAPCFRHPVVDEERIRLQATDWDQSFVFCFSSLTLLAVCQEGHPDRRKSVHLIPNVLFRKKLRKKTKRWLANSVVHVHGKTAVEIGWVGVCVCLYKISYDRLPYDTRRRPVRRRWTVSVGHRCSVHHHRTPTIKVEPWQRFHCCGCI